MITDKLTIEQHTINPTGREGNILPTILLIDDDEDQLFIFQTLLQCADAEVLTARSAQEGRRILLEHHVDLVVCDVFMPRYSGEDLIRQLRRDGSYKDLKIIAFSASSADLDQHLYRTGADIYCQKTDARRLLSLAKKELSQFPFS